MAGKISILIADDHEIFRTGLKEIFKKRSDIEIAGEAGTGTALLALAKKLRPDIIITDLMMPEMNGQEITYEISQKFPEINVIALTMSDDQFAIMDMMTSGAKAYLVKNASAKEIIEAVDTVQNNEIYFCHVTRAKIVKLIDKMDAKTGKIKFKGPQFTVQEKKIFELMCKEYTGKEIAEELRLSVRTVESHKEKLFKKTNTKNSAGLIMFAVRHNLS